MDPAVFKRPICAHTLIVRTSIGRMLDSAALTLMRSMAEWLPCSQGRFFRTRSGGGGLMYAGSRCRRCMWFWISSSNLPDSTDKIKNHN